MLKTKVGQGCSLKELHNEQVLGMTAENVLWDEYEHKGHKNGWEAFAGFNIDCLPIVSAVK